MWFIMLFIALIYDTILYFLRNQIYYIFLQYNKSTRKSWVVRMNAMFYWIYCTANKFPYLFLRPNSICNLNDTKNDAYNAIFIREKIIIWLEYIVGTIRKLLGIRIVYICISAYYIYINHKQFFKILSNKTYIIVTSIDYLKYIQSIWSCFEQNGSVILIISIVILLFYIQRLKSQSSKYELEAILTLKNEKKVKVVANVQTKIKLLMIQLHNVLCENANTIKKIIDDMDRWNKYSDKQIGFDVNKYNIQEYKEYIDKLKEYIKKIEDIGALDIFWKSNRNAFLQLKYLGLIGSDNWSYYGEYISQADKPIIDNILSEPISEKNYNGVRRNMIVRFNFAISFINCIECYLVFLNRRMNRYKRIKKKIVNTKKVKQILEDIK